MTPTLLAAAARMSSGWRCLLSVKAGFRERGAALSDATSHGRVRVVRRGHRPGPITARYPRPSFRTTKGATDSRDPRAFDRFSGADTQT
jgi:hypothetical protein